MDNTNKQIKISVLIPVYNAESYLRKCLDSVIAQTYRDIEIVCINDGSTDNSMEILKEYESKDERIRVVDKPHSGYGDSMNAGLKAATGLYIGIVESDDFINNQMYEKLYALTQNGTVDVVKANFFNYYEDGMTTPKIEVDHNRINIPDTNKPFVLKTNGQFILGHPSVWSAIYRREFLMENNVHFIAAKGKGMVDDPFYYETLCAAKSIMWLNEPLYYNRKKNPNSSENLQKDVVLPLVRMQDNFDVIERYHVTDVDTLKCVYARAMMYYTDALNASNYEANEEEINHQAALLMKRFDENIFLNNSSVADQQKYYSVLSPLSTVKSKCPKILIYNWLPFDNQWGWGGGVTVYCKNLIEEILKTNPEINIYFLSSGFAYMATELRTFYRKIGNIFGDRVHQYEIVNSPIPAEQRYMYVNPLVALENESLKEVFTDFLEKYGPFDAIHFNNIEGLSLDILDLKKQFPQTRFIFSIHNYVTLCVNGSYYMRHKHCNCDPSHTGEDCFKCTRADIRHSIAVSTYDRGKYGQDLDKCYSQHKWINNFEFQRLDEDVSPDRILEFAKTATEKLNENCDSILAVSKRVYEVAEANGFDTSKMTVSYIGTKVAEHQLGHAAYKVGERLKIVFLGNDIDFEEKGYPFLLETLHQLETKYASKIDLVLTVKQKEHAEIYSMLRHFNSLKVINGYTHDDLPNIFDGCNLSIVPVLWEDNLPQIAIESAAYGVPVLTSSAGGASELCDSELFRFESGNSEDMLAKIKHFVDNPDDLQEYWEHHHGLVTMKQHWTELLKIYGLVTCDTNTPIISMNIEEFRDLLNENSFLNSTLKKLSSQSTFDELRFQVNSLQAELEKEKRKKEIMKQEAKVIFQTDADSSRGEVGTELIMIELENFQFSDFYAEIKFVNISNIAPSYSDVLKISGTLLGDKSEKREFKLHQFEWTDGTTPLNNQICVYLKGKNKVIFWGRHNGIYSGYLCKPEILTSRASHDSAKLEIITKGFLCDYTARPFDAIYASSSEEHHSQA